MSLTHGLKNDSAAWLGPDQTGRLAALVTLFSTEIQTVPHIHFTLSNTLINNQMSSKAIN